MKQGDVGWIEKRRLSSRTLAYYVESHGQEWTSIREVAKKIASEIGIDTYKKRRSAIAIECHDRLMGMGIVTPPGYVPPWLRPGGQAPILRAKRITDTWALAFYDSFEWKQLRFQVLKFRGRKCECCGADNKTAPIHVDHIKSLRRHWHLRLEPSNLQVLCGNCNHGKGAIDETDFRISRPSQSSR